MYVRERVYVRVYEECMKERMCMCASTQERRECECWGDGSVVKVLSGQARGSEFDPQNFRRCWVGMAACL